MTFHPHPVDVPARRPESTGAAAPSVLTEQAPAFEYVSLSHITPAAPMTAEQEAEVMAYERYLEAGASRCSRKPSHPTSVTRAFVVPTPDSPHSTKVAVVSQISTAAMSAIGRTPLGIVPLTHVARRHTSRRGLSKVCGIVPQNHTLNTPHG